MDTGCARETEEKGRIDVVYIIFLDTQQSLKAANLEAFLVVNFPFIY